METKAEETRFERMCRLMTAPDMRAADETQQRQIAATIIFTLTGMTIFAAFALMVYRQGNLAAARTHLGVFFAYGAGFALVRMGVPTFAMYSNILATAVGIFGAMWFGGGLAAPATVFLATLPTVGVLSLGRRAGIYGAALAIGVVGATVALQAMGYEPRLDTGPTTYRKRIIESIVLVIEMYILAVAFQRLADRAYALLSDKRDELADLMNSMRQGLFTFDERGVIIGQHSSQARAIFGRADLEGESVLELLFADAPTYDLDREAFERWLAVAFELGRPGWEDLLELAPSSRVLREGTDEEQHLKLEVRPVFDGERLARVMMLVTDETAEVKLRRQIDENDAQRKLSAARLRRVAAAGAHTFVAYLSSSRNRIEGMRGAFNPEANQLNRPTLQQLFRHAHTVRGEARAFDLYELEQPMEEVERILRACLRAPDNDVEEIGPERRQALVQLVEQAGAAVDEAERRLVELSPIGEAVLDQVTVSRSDLDKLTQCVREVSAVLGAHHTADALQTVARRLSARPMGELVAQFTDTVQRWAQERDKLVNFEVHGKRCMIEPALAAVLPRALTHLLRNAIAHGIEAPTVREDLGKQRRGTVELTAREGERGVEIEVVDDGSGLDLPALREKATKLGMRAKDPAELIFENGLSTSAAVDSLSGQGVGMGAAQQALGTVGYRIEVESRPGRGTRFHIRPQPSDPHMRRAG